MKETGLKIGLTLFAFVLILSKHVDESRYYRIQSSKALNLLEGRLGLDTKRD